MAHLFYGARVHFFNPIDWLSLLLPATALVYFIDGRKVAFVTAAIISATAIIFTFLMNEEAQLMYMWLFLGLSAIGCTYAFIKYSFISPFFIFGAVSIYALILNGYKLGPLPWSSVAATAAVIGYYLRWMALGSPRGWDIYMDSTHRAMEIGNGNPFCFGRCSACSIRCWSVTWHYGLEIFKI